VNDLPPQHQEPARIRLANARPKIADKITWKTPEGGELRFHIDIGFEWDGARPTGLGRPLEIWLKPSNRAGKHGTTLYLISEGIAEDLSLLLQHGHSIGALYRRFKPGSLHKAVLAEAWRIAYAEGGDVARLDDELFPCAAPPAAPPSPTEAA